MSKSASNHNMSDILNQSRLTVHIDAEQAILGFPNENPKNPYIQKLKA